MNHKKDLQINGEETKGNEVRECCRKELVLSAVMVCYKPYLINFV